jgi:[acyl-carrier-protein] S-malonyltransferase
MKQTALLFPGGGSHYVGMGRAFYNSHKIVQEVFEAANEVLHYDLKRICFDGDLEVLSAMNHAQPAIFTASMAAYRVYEQEIGLVPAFAAGHSLGEYSALCAAGVIDFADALKIVRKRGELLHRSGEAGDKAMAAVSKIDRDSLEQEIGQIRDHQTKLFISVFNSAYQYVVAGCRNEVYALSKNLQQRGAEPVVLNISSPSHCPLMEFAVPAFAEALSGYRFASPAFPVISNVTGRPYQAHDDVKALLCLHLVKPVQWHDSMRWLNGQQPDAVIDIGPQRVLKNLTHHICPALRAYAFDEPETMEAIRGDFGIHRVNYRDAFKYCLKVAVSTRNRNAHPASYHDGVIAPYADLQAMAGRSGQLTPTAAEVQKAARLLEGILRQKGIADEKIKGYLEPVASPVAQGRRHAAQ